MRNGTASESDIPGESFVNGKIDSSIFSDYQNHHAAPLMSCETAVLTSLRNRYPDCTVTVTDSSTGLLAYAQAGQAKADFETKSESYSAWRMHTPSKDRTSDEDGTMSDDVFFGRYNYQWKDHKFLVYRAQVIQGFRTISNDYLVHKRDQESSNGRCEVSDQLIAAATKWAATVHDEVLVFDQEDWSKNKDLWESVQQANWDDVIMDKEMKENLINDVEGFFDCKEDYKEFAVPWKRGIICHGLPGNGKTISIKALMHALYARPDPIPTLYVKSLAGCHGPEFSIREIFVKARQSTPCLLVFEDLDSLITDRVKSFFLNELDGLESNEGLMMLGSTNHLERLDAGISKRPGRFDRKYHFALPATAERVKYCDFWKAKLSKKKAIEFPPNLSEAIAGITEGFSFAYLKEAFVTSLLMIVGSRRGSKEIQSLPEAEEGPPELRSLLLWRVMSKQVKVLRGQMEDSRKSAEEAAKNNDVSSTEAGDTDESCDCS